MKSANGVSEKRPPVLEEYLHLKDILVRRWRQINSHSTIPTLRTPARHPRSSISYEASQPAVLSMWEISLPLQRACLPFDIYSTYMVCRFLDEFGPLAPQPNCSKAFPSHLEIHASFPAWHSYLRSIMGGSCAGAVVVLPPLAQAYHFCSLMP